MHITTINSLVISLLAILSAIIYFHHQNQQKTIIPIPFCDVISLGDSSHVINQNLDEGKTLFKMNCSQCHAKDMKSNMTGPALGGVTERWNNYEKSDLYNYIRQSQKMTQDGHPRAKSVWKKWQPTIMNDFPNLTNDQIDNILLYIEEMY